MIKNINDLEKTIKRFLKESKYINFPGTEDVNIIDKENEELANAIIKKGLNRKLETLNKGSYFELISKLKELISKSGKTVESISIIREDDYSDIPVEYFRADCKTSRNCLGELKIYLSELEDFNEVEDIFFIEPERDAIMVVYSTLNNVTYLLTVLLSI